MDNINLTNTHSMPEDNGQYTVPCLPPVEPRTQRRSRWAELFEECRSAPGQWRKVREPLTKATAAQIASDLRNAHHRNRDKSRVKGLLSGDRWETAWGNDPTDSDPDHHYLWLRYVGANEVAA
jgi:hypothetical protein